MAQEAPAVSSGPSAPALFLEPLKSSVCFLPSPCTRHPPEAPPWAQAPSWGRFCVATPPPHMADDGDLLFKCVWWEDGEVAFFCCLEYGFVSDSMNYSTQPDVLSSDTHT